MPEKEAQEWTAVVLAGGRGTRKGGTDKLQVLIGGRSLLAHVVDGLPTVVPVVVVGPEQAAPRPVRFVRESPAFGGPVAALAAALPAVQTPVVGLVGADMPRAAPLLARLVVEWSGEEVLVAVDADGRRQQLCSVWATAALASALARLDPPAGHSLRDLLGLLEVTERRLDDVESRLLVDVDVPDDLTSLS